MTKELSLAAVLLAFSMGCSRSEKKTGGYPMLTPPVVAAAPVGFVAGSSFASSLRMLSLDPSDFKSRFFSSGPTDLIAILESVDSRIAGINSRIDNFPCADSASPTSYTITPMGQSVTMYAQCAENWSAGSGFDQFAQVGSTFYLYAYGAVGPVAAIV